MDLFWIFGSMPEFEIEADHDRFGRVIVYFLNTEGAFLADAEQARLERRAAGRGHNLAAARLRHSRYNGPAGYMFANAAEAGRTLAALGRALPAIVVERAEHCEREWAKAIAELPDDAPFLRLAPGKSLAARLEFDPYLENFFTFWAKAAPSQSETRLTELAIEFPSAAAGFEFAAGLSAAVGRRLEQAFSKEALALARELVSAR